VFTKPNRKVTRVFIHCTASDLTKHDSAAAIKRMHLDRGWSDIGYHLFIKKNGTLEIGRDLEKIPAAQKGHNTNSIAICLHGLKKDKFTTAQFDTLKRLCLKINKAYNGEISFHGHCEVAAKSCPVFDYRSVLKLDKYGSLGLNGAVTQKPVNVGNVAPSKLPDLKEGSRGPAVELLQELLLIKADGIFGPKTASAVREFKKQHQLYPSDRVISHVWKLLLASKEVEHFD
jgi:hypothetical protein